jgi:Membrane protein involved in the export of O-antigen and teichoic acid
MKNKSNVIQGTIILTLTGFITRIIGFFYRIFLSHTIGEEGMGIYQLIFPVYAMGFSLTAAGIQTSISRFVATKIAIKDEKSAKDILLVGLSISLTFSLLTSIVLYQNANFFASYVLDEVRCTDLLKVLALSLPFGSIHACINGYYYGLKKAHHPAISQLIEQIFRVFASYLICIILKDKNMPITPVIAVVGIVAGEFASMAFCSTTIIGHLITNVLPKFKKLYFIPHAQNILSLSLPLMANRVLLNVLQSIEAIMIPGKLRTYGMNTAESLSVYGVLTGMALPLILFPSAITNSVSVMLLPTIAEAQASQNEKLISKTIENTIKYCLILGIFATGCFLAYGPQVGIALFGSSMAGTFILILAWICPFLYLTTTLTSILNGLGKTHSTFIHNCIGLTIRILFVFFLVPKVGIVGYLWSLLIAELAITFLCVYSLKNYTRLTFKPYEWILKPIFTLALSIGITFFFQGFINHLNLSSKLIELGITLSIVCILYLSILYCLGTLNVKPFDLSCK